MFGKMRKKNYFSVKKNVFVKNICFRGYCLLFYYVFNKLGFYMKKTMKQKKYDISVIQPFSN